MPRRCLTTWTQIPGNVSDTLPADQRGGDGLVSPRHMTGPAKCRACGADRATAPQRRWACRGLCGACYRRWANHGFPGDGPGALYGPHAPRHLKDERMDAFIGLELRDLTTAEMCTQLGVTRRTLTRYRNEAGLMP